MRFTSKKLQGCCNDLFREPDNSKDGSPIMSTHQYLCACVSPFDLARCPPVVPDFYHFEWPGCTEVPRHDCCIACDKGWRFVSWAAVHAHAMEELKDNFRYPVAVVDFRALWGYNE